MDSTNLIKIVETALAQQHRSGLSQVLEVAANLLGAFGCILWRETPGSSLESDPPRGSLFVFAEWFSEGARCSLHNLSIRSATGASIALRRTVNVEDAVEDPRVSHQDAFLTTNGIRTFCATPVCFSDGKWGALNAYRTIASPLTKEEQESLEQIARLLPKLCNTIIDKVSFNLAKNCNKILQRGRSPKADLSKNDLEKTLQRLVEATAESLGALEVSVFLKSEPEHPKNFQLLATTWPDRKTFKKRTYIASHAEGLTGWVLERDRPLRLFDLANFEANTEEIQLDYPGLAWCDSLRIRKHAMKYLEIKEPSQLQPIAFMATPVRSSGVVLGAIRCCTAKVGPYFFLEQELRLLELVADLIGNEWGTFLTQQEIREQNNSWQQFVSRMKTLNRYIEDQAEREDADERRIYSEILSIAHTVVDNLDSSDVRLYDEATNELHFVATYGRAWSTGTPAEQQRRLAKRFPVNNPLHVSGGALVYSTGEIYELENVNDREAHYSETFPQTKRMIIAPVRVAGAVHGVLDIRGVGEREFPQHAAPIAQLLGQQLGLYRYLISTIKKLRDLPREQAQTYEDFTHQLKSPLLQVHSRARTCLMILPEDEGQKGEMIMTLKRNLTALRGQAAKAKRVGQSLGLFADLARGKLIEPRLSALTCDFVIKLLIEGAIDQESTLAPKRKIRFQIDRDSFNAINLRNFRADRDLFYQAVNNLLDNAAKYSYDNTVAFVKGSITGSGRFRLSVISTGIPIEKRDVDNCKKRNWRSDKARDVTGEGSGIGLWIVDNIMTAHGGDLLVSPTDHDGKTDCALLFPPTKTER